MCLDDLEEAVDTIIKKEMGHNEDKKSFMAVECT